MPSAPHNDLEHRLQDLHAGSLEAEEFIRFLLDTQVFMPVQDEKIAIKGFQRSPHAQPLVIEDENGTQVLILFSSPERAKVFLEQYPDYHGGLLTEFPWILRRIGSGVGISINPDWELGFDIDPEQAAALIASLPAESH
jgi:SseB protein N-terminal domain